MSSLERLLATIVLLVLLLFSGSLAVRHYGAEQYQAGQAAAVAAGRAQHERDTAAARKTESHLRAQLRDKDAVAFNKEKQYATNLAAGQRRMRAGDDRLRCPGTVPATTPPGDRPAAGGPQTDDERPSIVPEVAADLLGIAADIGGLVRRYERVVERFEACRAVNEK